MRATFKFLGLLCLLAAGGIAVLDLIAWARGAVPAFRPLGKFWFDIHPGSLQLLEPAVSRYLSQGLWSHGVQPVLEAPAALVFFALAAILLLFALALGRRRRGGKSQNG